MEFSDPREASNVIFMFGLAVVNLLFSCNFVTFPVIFKFAKAVVVLLLREAIIPLDVVSE